MRLPVGVKRRQTPVHFCPLVASKTSKLLMSAAALISPVTRNLCRSGLRVNPSIPLRTTSVRFGAHTSRSTPFATHSLARRQASSMASESYKSSESDSRNQEGRSSLPNAGESAPYAARAKAGSSVSNSFFPMGYREGFSQWVR